MRSYIARIPLAGKFGDRTGHQFAGVWPAPVAGSREAAGIPGVGDPSLSHTRKRLLAKFAYPACFAFQAGRLARLSRLTVQRMRNVRQNKPELAFNTLALLAFTLLALLADAIL